jgi:hypothetical protein
MAKKEQLNPGDYRINGDVLIKNPNPSPRRSHKKNQNMPLAKKLKSD